MVSVIVKNDADVGLSADESDTLTASIGKARLDLERAIQVAGLKNDPIAPLLRSVMTALNLQHRLHLASTGHLRDISERLDLQVSQSLALADSELAAKEAAIVSKLAPQLVSATDRSIRTRLWTIKLQTILISVGGAIVLMLAVLGAGYIIGFANGRVDGLHISNTLAASLARSDPETEADWARLMSNNDVRSALTECEKTITREGPRRACALPVWLDPPSPPSMTGPKP